MKYLCLIYNEERKLAAMSKVEREALVGEALTYDEELKHRGHFIAAHALQRTETAMTVRVRSGRVTATEGPVADLKEQLGGVILIDARDLNEAIQVASKMPGARVGSIEVRPVRGSDPKDGALC